MHFPGSRGGEKPTTFGESKEGEDATVKCKLSLISTAAGSKRCIYNMYFLKNVHPMRNALGEKGGGGNYDALYSRVRFAS